MKRVAFVSNKMNVGGIQTVLATTLNEFDYDKYDVTLWLVDDTDLNIVNLDPRIKIRFFGNRDGKAILKNQLLSFRLIAFFKGLLYRFLANFYKNDYLKCHMYSVKSLPLLDKEAYDTVILYHGCNTGALLCSVYSLKAKDRILWVHGRYDYSDFELKHFKKFNKMVFVSEYLKDEYLKFHPDNKSDTFVIYNPMNYSSIIEQSTEQIPELGDNSIVTVGRLSYLKGIHLIPSIARLLIDSGYKFKWYIIGEGEYRKEIEAEIEKSEVSNYVFLLGEKRNPFPYIKNCTIYVQPSLSEGFCTTTMEAKILKKPIVTTDAPGMREQITNMENGLIVDSITPESIFAGIKTLFDNPELQSKFIDNLNKYEFDNQKELNKIYSLLGE